MPKPNRQVIVDEMVKLVEQGKSYTQAMAVNGRRWQMPERTFNRYWKTANEQHTAKNEALKKKLAEVDEHAAIEARKKAIMTADERKELLTKIAKGELRIKKPFVISGKIMEYPSEPDAMDRMKAVAELNKMDGDYAPIKQAQTDGAGKDIVHPLNNEQVEKLIAELKTLK